MTARDNVVRLPKREPAPKPSCAPIINAMPVYRLGERNFCPGCGRSQFYIGRALAECAFCATAIPLAESPQ